MFLALWLRSPARAVQGAEGVPNHPPRRRDRPRPAYAETDVSDKHPWVRKQDAKSRHAVTVMGRERLRMLEGSAAAMAQVRGAMGRWGEQKIRTTSSSPTTATSSGSTGWARRRCPTRSPYTCRCLSAGLASPRARGGPSSSPTTTSPRPSWNGRGRRRPGRWTAGASPPCSPAGRLRRTGAPRSSAKAPARTRNRVTRSCEPRTTPTSSGRGALGRSTT
jgi:hypothetical protein